MDSSLFDRLSRGLAATPSRRTALAGLSGLVTVLLGGGEAVAKPKGTKAKRCGKGKKVCKGRCIPKRRCCRNGDCDGGRVCRQGRCGCPAGKKACQGRCIAKDACCGECGANQFCEQGVCAAKRCAQGGPCRVFITSEDYDGNLGGLAGADAKCQALANASAMTAGGTYKAWLSDATASPNTRFTRTASTGPYVRVDGAVVAENYARLTSEFLQNPIILTEQEIDTSSAVWTGTSSAGSRTGTHCLSWTSNVLENLGTIGEAQQLTVTPLWSAFTDAICSVSLPLYCFEQG